MCGICRRDLGGLRAFYVVWFFCCLLLLSLSPELVFASELDDIFDLGGKDTETQVHDPIEDINRKVFEFNLKVDKNVLSPLAVYYSGSEDVPFFIVIFNNIYRNVEEPSKSLGFLLGGDYKGALESLSRFLINSSMGFLGLLDIASGVGLPYKELSLDILLARAGFVQGPYIVLPLLGSATVRSIYAFFVKTLFNPLSYVFNPVVAFMVSMGHELVARLEYPVTSYDESLNLDAYSAWRSGYYQRMGFMVDDED